MFIVVFDGNLFCFAVKGASEALPANISARSEWHVTAKQRERLYTDQSAVTYDVCLICNNLLNTLICVSSFKDSLHATLM